MRKAIVVFVLIAIAGAVFEMNGGGDKVAEINKPQIKTTEIKKADPEDEALKELRIFCWLYAQEREKRGGNRNDKYACSTATFHDFVK